MTYAQFIAKLRAEAKDLAKPMHNDFTGDGSTTLFIATDAPILENSYVLQVGGVQKTEGAGNDYTVDLQLGLFTLASAPAATADVDLDFKYVKANDATWLTIINYVLDDMEGEFFREVDDEDFGDSVADQVSYNGGTGYIDVVNFWYKTTDDASVRWKMVSEFSNWRYSKDLNKIFLGRPFNSDGYPLRVQALKGFTRGDEVSDTLDIPSQFEGVLQLGCLWRFYDHLLAERVNIETKISKERTITPLQNLQALSAHYYKLYLKEKGRKKPTKPMRILGVRNPQGGTP